MQPSTTLYRPLQPSTTMEFKALAFLAGELRSNSKLREIKVHNAILIQGIFDLRMRHYATHYGPQTPKRSSTIANLQM